MPLAIYLCYLVFVHGVSNYKCIYMIIYIWSHIKMHFIHKYMYIIIKTQTCMQYTRLNMKSIFNFLFSRLYAFV